MTGQKRAGFFGLSLAVMALAGAAFALGGDTHKAATPPPAPMVFEWTAPTDGTAVVKYEVQIRTGGESSTDVTTVEVTTNQVTFPVEWLTIYEVRVRGIDATDQAGAWSIWSLAEDEDHEAPSF